MATPWERNPNISREFCQQVRQEGGLASLILLDWELRKRNCLDCPLGQSNECQIHVKNLIHEIMLSYPCSEKN